MSRWFATITVLVTMIPTTASGQLASPEDRREAIKHYREGQQLLVSEQWAKTAEAFTAAIKLDSLLTLAHYGLGQATITWRWSCS